MSSLFPEKTSSGASLPRALTHRQIAEELGVSRQLVGFALRGEGRMSDEVRQRILEVARVNGYDKYSNGAARSMAALRHGKKTTTGLMAVLFTPTFQGRPLSSVPFFMPFFEGLEGEAIERGLDLMLCPLRPQGLPRLVREGQVDGVVCLVTNGIARDPFRSLTVPLVNILLAWEREDEIAHTPALSMDTRSGGVLATRHLIELGHRNIAFLGFSGLPGAKTESQRFDGYCDALRENGLDLNQNLVETNAQSPTIEAGAEAMRGMLQRGLRFNHTSLPFTGLFCSNDLLAMGAVTALQEAGLRVPEDVSVVGFDDVSTHYGFRPTLTSIRFPREEMGRRAVQLLSEMGNEDTPASHPNHEIFSVQLIEHDSTRRLAF